MLRVEALEPEAALRRGTLVTVVVVLFALAGASPASATIVFERNNEVWAMNDDGSDQRVLATPGALGVDDLHRPHVAPNGSTVMFDGATNVNYHGCGFPTKFYFGDHAGGVFRWRDGAASRLTGSPGGKGTCRTSTLSDAEATTNGRYMYVAYSAASGSSQTQTLRSASQEGGDPSLASSTCDNDSFLADPSPNPANPGQYAYLGCPGSNAGEIAIKVWTGTAHVTPSVDDEIQRDVAWRADGGLLVAAETGQDPGIWTYPPAEGGPFIHALNGDVTGVGFMGPANDRIVFAAQGDLWTIPANCTGCTMGNATRLTSSGGNSFPSWTSATLKPAAAQPPQQPQPQQPQTPQPPATPGPVDVRTVIEGAGLLGRPTSKRVSLVVALTAPAKVEFTFFQMKGRKAKKLGTVSKQGIADENIFHFKKAGRKKFKRGKYRTEIRAVLNGKKSPPKRVGFTIKK